MIKNDAIKIINKHIDEHRLTLVNTHWANLTNYKKQVGWWLNIPFEKFSKELYLVLNNKISKQFFYISIPKNSIIDAASIFRNKEKTADIFISTTNTDFLSINDILIDTQSNSTQHIFSDYNKEIFSYNYENQSEDLLFPEEISDSLIEGSKKSIIVNSYERNPKARSICIKKHGVSCVVCKFNFKDFYGERGDNFIHVHHLIAISDIGDEYEINPINDLNPVCPNCHAMLHRKGNISIKTLINEIKYNKTI